MTTQRTNTGIKICAAIALAAALIAGLMEYRETTHSVHWLSVNDAFRRAGEKNKPVYIDFYAEWCEPCKQMDKTTFASDSVIAMLKNEVFAARINVDDILGGKQFAAQYKIEAMPTSMLLTPNKLEIKRQVGYMNSQEFIRWVTSQ